MKRPTSESLTIMFYLYVFMTVVLTTFAVADFYAACNHKGNIGLAIMAGCLCIVSALYWGVMLYQHIKSWRKS